MSKPPVAAALRNKPSHLIFPGSPPCLCSLLLSHLMEGHLDIISNVMSSQGCHHLASLLHMANSAALLWLPGSHWELIPSWGGPHHHLDHVHTYTQKHTADHGPLDPKTASMPPIVQIFLLFLPHTIHYPNS